ncbi:hypothetical protein GON03_00370 [Nocardioides sp. MAH-18]|uniref:histidine kinase n=1 Tax=Nocardioides agri TaxID=2682843 RepID=A0A6L6XM20_9ACTN|nr:MULTISPECIES: ATP-binding protein [unclassified Nocardioides]MBA2956469.1 hypothetical protein [Nocardioides sp. CGMCC 1.13656]MVQ47616.1 hypothetical protein [Nocardioides sp. MAH-18]
MLESKGAARRRAWRRAGLDPRTLQIGFVLLLAISLLSGVPLEGWDHVPLSAWLALGLGGVAILVVLAVTPRVGNPRWLIAGMALAATGILGVSALDLDVGTLPLVVLPALAFARYLRWWSVPAAGGATTVLVVLPAILAHGNDDGTVAQVLPLPFVAMLSAAAISVWLDMAYAARRRERAALAEVERQRRRIDALVGAVDVGLQLVDVTGERVFTNTRMRELYELRLPQGVEDPVGHVYPADCAHPIALDELPSVRGGRGEEFDGLRIWVGEVPSARRALAVNARNVYDENGRRTGSALAYQDVTELMRALRVKDEFIGLVSHELRTPLTSIYGYVSILSEREDLPEQVDRQLAVISRSTDRLKLLVDDLLEATQVAGTGMRVELAPCLLADVVAEVVVAAKPHAAAAQVDLRLVLPDDDPVPGDLDCTRIGQVVDNLVSNAIKYTPAGGRAEVRLTRCGDQAELVVSDSGIGIREEDLPLVFGRFYRTQEAAEHAIQGLGLGLAITRTIVEAHGGKVEVASRLGEGSTFRVVLPLGEDV